MLWICLLLMKKFDLLSFNNYNSRINNKESIRIRDNYMCNLSQGIREEGLAEGLTKGLEKGVAKGRIDTTLCYVKPVSYTHLDVYKRQISESAGCFVCECSMVLPLCIRSSSTARCSVRFV